MSFSKGLKFAAALAITIAALALGFGVLLATSDDPGYRIKEFLSMGKYHAYDDLIWQASKRYEVPPELIKAVIWRESRFHPEKVGTKGERGLMQITEAAAADWANAEKIETFVPTDLFDAKVNIDAGTWYLSRALQHWRTKDDPLPFALAEYNAGRTRVHRWINESGRGEDVAAVDLAGAMDFPSTRAYVASILNRQKYYLDTKEFPR